ncbi:hypothetical protein SNOG_05852 [Parastagonospora nodorum SN15]|uniref:Uncharacterized protein n=1 Tax=Phaeosphaeria nodorum (strain SN15 / ATCC MYA-4574 / FGSC 10173) TaxID=321614 RepID=Q0UQW2_PHANO|nr:hypothetical protein SNOG_05852 [Parastagonospora nodorum SN15]EAT86916.1 hypothetical protein SNOG_05852 [Parastagonospora nodorum SN15]
MDYEGMEEWKAVIILEDALAIFAVNRDHGLKSMDSISTIISALHMRRNILGMRSVHYTPFTSSPVRGRCKGQTEYNKASYPVIVS